MVVSRGCMLLQPEEDRDWWAARDDANPRTDSIHPEQICQRKHSLFVDLRRGFDPTFWGEASFVVEELVAVQTLEDWKLRILPYPYARHVETSGIPWVESCTKKPSVSQGWRRVSPKCQWRDKKTSAAALKVIRQNRSCQSQLVQFQSNSQWICPKDLKHYQNKAWAGKFRQQ